MDSIALASYMMKKFEQYEQGIVDYTTSGNIKSMEDYKFAMGELSMLRTLREEIREALQFEGDPTDE
jgi:hypothetical protein|tara:strand:+ start:115 stop:315 length:201 start_codon:yes stop_codon:yes gene_type:complete